MTPTSRIVMLLISLLLVIASEAADEKTVRLRRQLVAFDDSGTSSHPHGDFMDTLWNVDIVQSDRQLGSGGLNRVRGKKTSGKRGSRRESSSGKKGKSSRESYEMSMSMSFAFYF